MQTLDVQAVSAQGRVINAVAPNAVPESANAPLLGRQARHESNARSYPRRLPLALKSAKGIHVQDMDGRRYIDCLAGAGTLALGHNHPRVIAAIRQVLDDELPLHTLDLTTPVKDLFMQRLLETLPASFAAKAKIQFCSPSGSDAVEAALKLVRIATGRRGVLAFQGGYHGMTQGALGLMGSQAAKQPLEGTFAPVQFLPYPYDFRCPFGVGGEEGVRLGLRYIQNLLEDPEGGVAPPAAVIVEAVQGEGGVVPAALSWLRGLREITRRAGVALIVDEIQSGFGRTGKMFAFEHAGIEPDVVVLSKAIGGSLPLAVMVYREELDLWKPGAHAGTFRGNQLAMAAGIATLDVLRDEQLAEHAATMGERLSGHLRALQCDHPCMGDVRGRGLMLGVEIVDSQARDAQGNPAADAARASRIQASCLRHGLILELGGRYGAVVRFLPPLIITAAQVDEVADLFGRALQESVLPSGS
jgi:diaminobutyrate-2-oxoglutarate transaminase